MKKNLIDWIKEKYENDTKLSKEFSTVDEFIEATLNRFLYPNVWHEMFADKDDEVFLGMVLLDYKIKDNNLEIYIDEEE